MARTVPVGRRNLLSDRRRVAVSLLGVGLAVALMLLIQGLWSGTLDRITAYEDNVGAQLFVAEPGTRSFQSDVSAIPPSVEDQIREVPGVQAADGVAARQLILELHGTKMPLTLIGTRTGGLGGPWALEAGRAVTADDEIVIDAGLAADHGYRLGEQFELLGVRLEIVGLTPDSRALGNGGYVFVSLATAGLVLGAPDATSFVLVRTSDPVAVASEIESRTGREALTAEEIARGDRALYDDTMGSVIRVMLLIAFAAGTLIAALSVYSSVIDRIREYGIVKALGASRRRLLGIVLAQTGALALAGGVAGLGLFLAAKVAVGAWLPQFHIELPASILVAAFVVVAAMALVAAILPARRLGRLDPASVYRG
ncbi:MAG TPA: ABC transporter permease [Actinomycetota bacterium]